MDTSFCKKIDEEMLVEQYVKDKLNPEEREQFELHLKDCKKHTQAVALEKAFHRGISEYARSEIRSHLKRSIRKKETMRFYILRYAAILFIVVITPLMLYYQFYMPQPETDQILTTDDEAIISEEESIEPQLEPAPVSEDRASRERKEIIRSKDLIEQSRATQPEQLPKQIKTPPRTVAKATQMLSEEKIIEEELEPVPTISGSEIQSLQSKSRVRDVAGSGVTFFKSQSVEHFEERMNDCIVINRSELTVDVYEVTYSYRIDSTGSANAVTLVKASQQNSTLDSCLKKTIQNWKFSKPMTDSLVTRTFKFNID
jgi:hypothetical protein